MFRGMIIFGVVFAVLLVPAAALAGSNTFQQVGDLAYSHTGTAWAGRLSSVA